MWHIAQKAGVENAFFIDTGLEFPETIEFVKSQNVEFISKAGNFWQAVEKAGPPAKDHRWCCKLLKLNPLKVHLNETGLLCMHTLYQKQESRDCLHLCLPCGTYSRKPSALPRRVLVPG